MTPSENGMTPLENGMTLSEWEALCNRCGKCCYYKEIRDGKWHLTDVPCDFLNQSTNTCTVYQHRHIIAPDCVIFDPDRLPDWLPSDCGYRRYAMARDKQSALDRLNQIDVSSAVVGGQEFADLCKVFLQKMIEHDITTEFLLLIRPHDRFNIKNNLAIGVCSNHFTEDALASLLQGMPKRVSLAVMMRVAQDMADSAGLDLGGDDG